MGRVKALAEAAREEGLISKRKILTKGK